jgi:peroxiredoxin Q/BCP
MESKPIKIGDLIPTFSLPDQYGELFDISSVIGKKKLVIFFYPRDESPGCTRQACYFGEQYEEFKAAGAEIIGISGQSVESHKNFAGKHELSYRVLSDTGNKVRKMFGVPADLFGLLPGRVTYITNMDGKVVHIFNSQLKPEKHVDEALKIILLLKKADIN